MLCDGRDQVSPWVLFIVKYNVGSKRSDRARAFPRCRSGVGNLGAAGTGRLSSRDNFCFSATLVPAIRARDSWSIANGGEIHGGKHIRTPLLLFWGRGSQPTRWSRTRLGRYFLQKRDRLPGPFRRSVERPTFSSAPSSTSQTREGRCLQMRSTFSGQSPYQSQSTKIATYSQ